MADGTEGHYREVQARLARALAEAGPVLPGSIVERWTRCGSAGCHCRAEPPRPHGPYPQWNRSVGGRTVTHLLSAEQLGAYQPRIEAARRLRQLLGELEEAGAALAETEQGWGRRPAPHRGRAAEAGPSSARSRRRRLRPPGEALPGAGAGDAEQICDLGP